MLVFKICISYLHNVFFLARNNRNFGKTKIGLTALSDKNYNLNLKVLNRKTSVSYQECSIQCLIWHAVQPDNQTAAAPN